MDERYDIVIIGSGLGGLVSGYILAKNGYKVAVLEKNSQIGGCLQTFKRFGVKFDTGMHYIGAMDEGQILYKLFRYLNLHKIPLSKLDTNGYDILSIGGEIYKHANGYEHFVETLAAAFPNNIGDIKKYVSNLQTITNASPIYNMQPIVGNIAINTDYFTTSVNKFIENITQNSKLQNVLAGNLPLYAGVKNITPMYIHAMISNFYMQSAYRIVGGSDVIANELAKSIQAEGGSIFTKAEVTEITCNDTHAVSAKLANGNEIFAKYFISDIHPQALLQIVHTPLLRKVYRNRINSINNTISNFSIYIKFKENAVKYNNYNYYYYRSSDVWKAVEHKPDEPVESYWFMHQCHQQNCEYAQSAELIAYMDFAEVEKWKNTQVGRRGDDYKEFKQLTAEKYLHSLEEAFPGIIANIESYETSSPLTYYNYTNTQNGSLYGVLRDVNAPSQTVISQHTKVPNLFLTGQNTNSHGILGTTISSIITCAELVDINKIINDINK